MKNRNWIDVPELVAFNVTSRCNLNCTYCFERVNSNQSQDASFGETISVLNQLDSFGVPEVLLEGGEIFAAPFIKELLSMLSDYNIRFHLITNGTLLTPKLADMISKIDLSVGVSLDGHTPELNLYRGGEKIFYKILSAIEMLVSRGVTTYVNCTVTRHNVDFIKQLIELCDELNVYGIVLQQLHCSGNADKMFYFTNFINYIQMKKAKDIYEKAKHEYPRMHIVNSELFDWIDVPERYLKVCNPDLEYKPKKIHRCAAGRRFCVITSNLDVIPCGILENFNCGNLREKSLKEIWNNSEGLNFIRRISEFRVDEISTCKDCIYNPICDGGCRGDMFNYIGDWLAPHIFCPYKNFKESQHD